MDYLPTLLVAAGIALAIIVLLTVSLATALFSAVMAPSVRMIAIFGVAVSLGLVATALLIYAEDYSGNTPIVPPVTASPRPGSPGPGLQPQPPLQAACVADTGTVKTEVYKEAIYEVTINLGSCLRERRSPDPLAPFASPGSGDSPSAENARVADRVRVQLLAPNIPDLVTPLTSGEQIVRTDGDAANWAFLIYPKQPGDRTLTLSIEALDIDGNLVYQNRTRPVYLTSSWTAEYFVGATYRGLLSFLTSLTGLATAIVAAFAAIYGIRKAWTNRTERNGSSDSKTVADDESRYL